MKKLIIFLLMMLPLGVFAQESKIAIVYKFFFLTAEIPL